MPLLNTVVVVDDHPIFLKGLTHLLVAEPGFRVVAEATSLATARDAIATHHPTVALVDLSLGEDNGLDLIKEIRQQSPDTRVLVLSMHDEKFYAERALSAGASGYCMKEEAVDHLMEALKAVVAGRVWTSPRLGEWSQNRPKTGTVSPIERLSDREFQIFSLLGKGLGTLEMAAKLHLSSKTIDSHKENMKVKLGCGTSQELRQLAVEWQTGEARGRG